MLVPLTNAQADAARLQCELQLAADRAHSAEADHSSAREAASKAQRAAARAEASAALAREQMQGLEATAAALRSASAGLAPMFGLSWGGFRRRRRASADATQPYCIHSSSVVPRACVWGPSPPLSLCMKTTGPSEVAPLARNRDELQAATDAARAAAAARDAAATEAADASRRGAAARTALDAAAVRLREVEARAAAAEGRERDALAQVGGHLHF